MSYQWPVDPQDLFGEREPQMINLGLPAADVAAVGAALVDMWAAAPGGWGFVLPVGLLLRPWQHRLRRLDHH